MLSTTQIDERANRLQLCNANQLGRREIECEEGTLTIMSYYYNNTSRYSDDLAEVFLNK